MTILTSPLRQLRARAGALRGRGQDGFAAIFTICTFLTVMLAVGFVLDAGLAMDGWVRADNEAEQAARAGAQALDLAVYRESGQAVLNPTQAVAAANSFLAAAGDTGTVTVTVQGTTVTVTVTRTHHTALLGLVGISTLTAHATAHATAEQTT